MPGMSGLEVARAIRDYDSTIQCIVLTGHASLESAVQALREQVYDYIGKPVSITDLARIVGRAAEHARLLRRKRETDAELAARSQELASSLEALRDAEGRLVRTENAALMGQLAEGLRHELGNALTIIRLNMNLLAYYREDPERFARHMASLGQGVQAIERIALALRFFPTTDGDDGELLDLAAVIRQSANEALQAHETRSASVHFDLVEPAPVRGSLFQLIRAFVGIVENAIEASAGQEGPPMITITLERDAERWLVAVRDHGRGFTAEALEHALEPGFTTKIERGYQRGLGLGLFVASHVLDRHGGALRLSNLPEGGALVQAWLPRADE
jgi:two-component system C4-dicarboxylate transport sensor histidine kinase DctB